MIFRINTDYFPKQHQPTDLRIGDALYYLDVGTESSNINLDELRAPRG